MGNRRMTKGSNLIVSHSPMNSVFQVGFFIRTILVPSSRTTSLALHRKRARNAPQAMRMMKAM